MARKKRKLETNILRQSGRTFLNGADDGLAACEYDIHVYREMRYRKRRVKDAKTGEVRYKYDDALASYITVNASLTVSDCSRQITLDFDCSTKRNGVAKRLRKVRKLMAALGKIEVGLVKAEAVGAVTKQAQRAGQARRAGRTGRARRAGQVRSSR